MPEIAPVRLFKDSRVKLEIGLCRGRRTMTSGRLPQRDAKREIDRTLKERNR